MKVDLPHSLDFHSAEVNPGKRYADLAPGKSMQLPLQRRTTPACSCTTAPPSRS